MKKQDGAFYGPKIDVHIKDSLGVNGNWQQYSWTFINRKLSKLTYIDNEGNEKRPVMIHRAIFGSFERFIGILTEHFQGAFPVYLSPVQVVIVPISKSKTNKPKKLKLSSKKKILE